MAQPPSEYSGLWKGGIVGRFSLRINLRKSVFMSESQNDDARARSTYQG